MDRFRHKHRKEKPQKNYDKEKSVLVPDLKTVRESLKMKEIFGNVKINSSMRLKAPPGKRVLQNNDFNEEGDDCFEEVSNEIANSTIPACAMNTEVITETDLKMTDNEMSSNKNETTENEVDVSWNDNGNNEESDINTETEPTENVLPENDTNLVENNSDSIDLKEKVNALITNERLNLKLGRERKLSLDHTILTRNEQLSQSMGKLPLQRKSSFFRKKLDSFIKNTTDLFHRQSLEGKTHSLKSDSMSTSLQSLNEQITNENESLYNGQSTLQGSATSLHSSSTLGYSPSLAGTPIPGPNSDTENLASSQPTLCIDQPLDKSSTSINSLNECPCKANTLLNSRAISMSSGLDAHGQKKKKSNSYKRRSWFGSERNKEIQEHYSYQDFTSIPENICTSKLITKERRLSYQRAVSGEDPVYISKYQDSTRRKNDQYEMLSILSEFSRDGIPPLKNFVINRDRRVFSYLYWVDEELENIYDWRLLDEAEESRQAVIRELIITEAHYLRHLLYIVEVCIGAAHALQERNFLLYLQTDNLFSNLPDVMNAGFSFFEAAFCPMIVEAVERRAPFNIETMYPGFSQLPELFRPYDKFLCVQAKCLDYLRSLNTLPDFQAYAAWCQEFESSNRLSFADILIKPMQRVTKYSILIRRIRDNTYNVPDRTLLGAMENLAKNYVTDINRSIRQIEELEKLAELACTIDGYELEFKDDDLDRCFNNFYSINLHAPMPNCVSTQSRTIIHQADFRFKDNLKEMETRIIILTDMLLVCKKLNQKSGNERYTLKLVRPKYRIDRLVVTPKYARNLNDYAALIIVALDHVGSSYHCFLLQEMSKDSSEGRSLKLWELKIKEAKITYELSTVFAGNPSCEVTDLGHNNSSDGAGNGPKTSSEEMQIEREARERVAAMLHNRSFGASTDYDYSQSFNTDSVDGTSSARNPRVKKRMSTGESSRNSRLSSFQQSASAASHDEPQPGPSRINYRAGSSVEHIIPPINPEDNVTSITVNVVSESESETVVPIEPPYPPHGGHMYKLRSPTGCCQTLCVQPQDGAKALVHSLPDLSLQATGATGAQSSRPHKHTSNAGPKSASDWLYHSHQEGLQQRNKLTTGHQYLAPDNRGTSYPPPSPTRLLKRGLAFSYSFKNPPLSKMGHVNSQSQLQPDPFVQTKPMIPYCIPLTRRYFHDSGESSGTQSKSERSSPSTTPVPGPSSDKNEREKKPKSTSAGHKDRRSPSPVPKDSDEETPQVLDRETK